MLVASKSGLSYIAATLSPGLVLFPSSFWRHTKCDDLWLETNTGSTHGDWVDAEALQRLFTWYADYHPLDRPLPHVALLAVPQAQSAVAGAPAPYDACLGVAGLFSVGARVDLGDEFLYLPKAVWPAFVQFWGDALRARDGTSVSADPAALGPACPFADWAAGACGNAPAALGRYLEPPPPVPLRLSAWAGGQCRACPALRATYAAPALVGVGKEGLLWSRVRPHSRDWAVVGGPVGHCLDLIRTNTSAVHMVPVARRGEYCVASTVEPCGPGSGP